MNGRFLLDTNAVIALLRGEKSMIDTLIAAEWIGISVISELEFLGFRGISPDDEALFGLLKNKIDVIGLSPSDQSLLEKIILVRRTGGHKMPDSIIAATAMEHQATLLTRDVGFSKITNLVTQNF
jgi:tRNA(fMet)-specific endonuclease VapC